MRRALVGIPLATKIVDRALDGTVTMASIQEKSVIWHRCVEKILTAAAATAVLLLLWFYYI